MALPKRYQQGNRTDDAFQYSINHRKIFTKTLLYVKINQGKFVGVYFKAHLRFAKYKTYF